MALIALVADTVHAIGAETARALAADTALALAADTVSVLAVYYMMAAASRTQGPGRTLHCDRMR